jgi:hypothetical protein
VLPVANMSGDAARAPRRFRPWRGFHRRCRRGRRARATRRARARTNALIDWFNTGFYRSFGYGLIYPQALPDQT